MTCPVINPEYLTLFPDIIVYSLHGRNLRHHASLDVARYSHHLFQLRIYVHGWLCDCARNFNAQLQLAWRAVPFDLVTLGFHRQILLKLEMRLDLRCAKGNWSILRVGYLVHGVGAVGHN